MLNNLPSVGYLHQWFHALLSRVEVPAPIAGAAVASLAEVAIYHMPGLAEIMGGSPGKLRRQLETSKSNC